MEEGNQMSIRERVERLVGRMPTEPQYPTQGAVLFVDLERRETRRAYLPAEVFKTFLSNRGANMMLLYNLMDESRDPLDGNNPLIFGAGTLTSNVPGATRGNVTGLSPESHALLDASAGDYFPSYMRRHGYEHIVLFGDNPAWTLLRLADDAVEFLDAEQYLGMDNIDFTAAIEHDFACEERRNMALARCTVAGENGVLCAGIMGGPKAIWARGGSGAKMGSLKLKGILIQGEPPEVDYTDAYKKYNKVIGKKILSTSVIRNALKKVGTPFLYKPSRVLGSTGAKNNQETTWVEDLDADMIDPYRPGMDGCFKCPVHCRARNDLTPEGKGGYGAHALKGLKGNASYDKQQADIEHQHGKTYQGFRGDNQFDKYDKGDGPEYVTLGKFGPSIGITQVEHVLRFNNICNDLGLDTASTGSTIAWAMELYQRGIITQHDTGGLELTWGNHEVIEKLLFMTSRREGFGDVIADSSRAVEKGKYPAEALDYCMAVKGLFQSDPHDARILKAFALGLAVATRGMDHLRNRVTLEINARVNDDPEFKKQLYGGVVSAEPTSYAGKEIAVRRTENTFAAGDAVGMCRFNTNLFNSPKLPDVDDFATQLTTLTGLAFSAEEIDECGRNITGLEHMINFRIGLRAADDTLPKRWFDEPNTFGPFKGEKIDRAEFQAMRTRFYAVTGLNSEGLPQHDWHRKLSQVATGFAVEVELPPGTPGVPDGTLIVDEPVDNVVQLRDVIARRLPEAAEQLGDRSLNIAVNDQLLVSGELTAPVRHGDRVTLLPMLGGG
jgi:aldehyde:ferredoxin oxidoreductase